MKLVVTDGESVNPGDLSWSALERFGSLTVYGETEPCQLIERLRDAHVAFPNKVSFTDEVFAACPNLRCIIVMATGYDKIDIEAARRRGVTVCNIPGYSTGAVAQHTMALLLEICGAVGEHTESVRRGDWCRSKSFSYWLRPLAELEGKTFGAVGFGSIGKAAARLAAAFGMEVLAHSPSRTPGGREDGVELVSLRDLYARSDVISLHCPLTAETREMICSQSISRMKDGVILLNTARGNLVREEDLAEALRSGKVAAAGVDVVSQEPILLENPLLSAPNCFVTPHIAWVARETRQRLLDSVARTLELFLKGTPINVVNL